MFLSKLKSLLSSSTQKTSFKSFPDLSANQKETQQILKNHPTPIFLGSKKVITNRYNKLKQHLNQSWGVNNIIAYSFKTNYAVAQSKILKHKGAWAEVVSGKEYRLAKKLGYSGKKIILNGPYKTDAEISKALNNKTLIHIDNNSELLQLENLTKKVKTGASIGIRLNTHIKGTPHSRFGFSIDSGQAEKIVKRLTQHKLLCPISLHIHIGTDIDKLSCYKKAAQKVGSFAHKIVQAYKTKLQYIDLGGGFPSHGLKPFHKSSWQPQLIGDYINTIATQLKQQLHNTKNLKLVIEPGRYLVDDAITFITKVVHAKVSPTNQVLITNGTITMLPLVHYRPQIVRLLSAQFTQVNRQLIPSIVYGATCQESDILYNGLLPTAEIGNYLIFYCTGAYNQTMGSDFIFEKPKTLLTNHRSL